MLKGGAGRTQVSASPAPLSLVGRDRGGTPCPPPPRWIWQPLSPASRRGGAVPPAPADRGPRRRPPSGAPQENPLPSDSNPCCCSARPFGSQGGVQTERGPSRPHLAFGSLNPRLWGGSRSRHHGAWVTYTHPCPPRMRLRNSTQGQRRQISPPRCPIMMRPRQLPPAATLAAFAGVAVVAAGMKSDGGRGGPPRTASCSPSPAARRAARRAPRRCRAGRSPSTS